MRMRWGVMLAALLTLAAAPAMACTITIGVVMSLTGPAGPFGQTASKAVNMAFRDLNQAGGVNGCTLAAEIRDAQSQGSVGVDVAKQLVAIDHVPAIIGAVISSVSLPILTAVTGPGRIVQISPASSSPTFTQLAKAGKTHGYWFRTITSDALQGVAAAKYALSLGFKRIAIIHVNNDFGVNMEAEFARAYRALGGTILSDTPYDAGQSSYAAEVARGIAEKPDALYLISYPGDGTTIARTWIAQGGVRKFLLNDGMNDAGFIKDVGPAYLDHAYGTSSGTETTASTAYFATAFPAYAHASADAPAAPQAYDSAAILGLAIAEAGSAKPRAIRDAMRRVLDPKGTVVGAGPAGFRKALALIKAGKPIRYEGVIGPVSFDRWGDITGPFRLWRIQGGKVVTTGTMSTAEIDAIKAKLGK